MNISSVVKLPVGFARALLAPPETVFFSRRAVIRHLKDYRKETESAADTCSMMDVGLDLPFFCLLADLCTKFNLTKQETIEVMGVRLWQAFSDWLDTQVEPANRKATTS